MTTLRQRLSASFVLVLAFAGGVWRSSLVVDDGAPIPLSAAEMDAFRIKTPLMDASDEAARAAMARAIAATGKSPIQSFSIRASWCVPLASVDDADASFGASMCFADRACRATCAGAESTDCVDDCPRDSTCVASEGGAISAAAQWASTTDPTVPTHRCADWRMTPALRARFESVRPDVGQYATGDDARGESREGLAPVVVDDDEEG